MTGNINSTSSINSSINSSIHSIHSIHSIDGIDSIYSINSIDSIISINSIESNTSCVRCVLFIYILRRILFYWLLKFYFYPAIANSKRSSYLENIFWKVVGDLERCSTIFCVY